ncbi:hypothetical protein TIFTF001_004129 [Ficus carica]|uniref:Uncharacterized protein n=1 Tax=Ficus carica TaxID=3494 RepID=A0AA88CSQ5_FICCA|nr:hypothetical protein TIFTF001_004129 [Ficus carica]
MSVLLYKRLVLVTFILICFFSATARGRSLGVISKGHDEEQKQKLAEKVEQEQHQEQEEVVKSANDLLTMDYTPARKKPPIHN